MHDTCDDVFFKAAQNWAVAALIAAHKLAKFSYYFVNFVGRFIGL